MRAYGSTDCPRCGAEIGFYDGKHHIEDCVETLAERVKVLERLVAKLLADRGDGGRG